MTSSKNSVFILLFVLIPAVLTTSCNMRKKENLPLVKEIGENWEFRQTDKNDWLPATVPGTVHSDLLHLGLIEDPYYRMNESDLQWIENKDWIYRTSFLADKHMLAAQVVELNFEGLDTYADVYLNDNHILKADNMFVGWKVNCKDYLKLGENELRVYFHSPVAKGMKKLKQLNYIIPATNEQAPIDKRTNVFTRKAPFHYGWDWGPRLVTSGIWRPVKIKAWNHAIIEDVYLVTQSANETQAKITADVEVLAAESGDYRLQILINGKDTGVRHEIKAHEGNNLVRAEFTVDNPRLWWTNGLGEPYLYNISFRLEKKRVVIDRYDMDYGIRTLRLVQEPDSIGHSFYFELNGRPVFMKGANIIPSEVLTPSVTEETFRKMISSAVDANMNMLRVWGGAIYEDDIFYQLCDAHGILVWQDFMFACALQPGDEAHLENIRLEAEYNIRRLRNHASLALWCGNNENLEAWHHWGWQDNFIDEERAFMWLTYERIFHEILPEAVEKYDPKNAYWASSPSSIGNQIPDRKSGDEHDWTIWFGQKDFSGYREDVPRFVSEWGLQAFPAMATISSFSTPEDHDIHSPVMRHRQRSRMSWVEPGFDGNDMIKRYMSWYYKVPEDFDRFTYVSQLLQAKAYKTAIEAHRSAMPHCMGTLYWQLNDCWPTISWATVDYFYRWKASHYAVKKAFEPVIITGTEEKGSVTVYAVSDKYADKKATLVATFMDFSGNIISQIEKDVMVSANKSTLLLQSDFSELLGDTNIVKTFLSLELVSDGELMAENILFFTEPKNLQLTLPSVEYSLVAFQGGYDLNLKSDVLVKGLFIDTPDPDARFSDNYFDLMPGQGKTIRIKTEKSINADNEIKLMYLNEEVR